MKKFYSLVFMIALLCSAQWANAFDYNGLSYEPTGEVSLLTMQPTCAVTGFASDNKNGTVIDIPADFAIDPETNVPYWPIKIAAYAFKDTKAAVVSSLGTIQEIGDYAFYNTRIAGNLSSITVMNVGNYAFYSCNLLTSVEFAACTRVGDYAFAGCNLLLSAVFPLLQKIKQHAFENCTELLHFELPITLEYLGDYAFAGCVDMNDVVNMSEKLLTTIPQGCFQGCEDLKEFHFPDCVKRIEAFAFDGCSSMDKISIPKEVEYIGDRAFQNCKQATLVYIHGLNTEIYGGWVNGSVFSGCSAVEEVRLCRTKESVPFYTLFPDSKQSLKRVRILEGSTSIGKLYDYGFYKTEFGGYVNLEKVEIAEGVTMIGCMAFQGCPSLRSITLPKSLDSICPDAFSKSGIETIDIPDNVNYIGSYAFEQCVNLKSIKWSNSLTQLPWNVCRYDSALLKVDLPASITSIGRGAFEGCVSVGSVTIASKQTEWENDYFAGCPNIKKLTFVSDDNTPQISTLLRDSKSTLEELILLPGSTCLGTINNKGGRRYSYATLAGFGKLKSVYIPEGVTMIGYQAFEGDTLLTSITLPSTVDTIGGYAFRNTNIEKIVLPKRITYIADRTFEGCKKLQKVGFSQGLHTIEACAFQDCSSLTHIDLPFSVGIIETSVFANCTGLKSITIGDKLTKLGNRAFQYCSSLENMTCYTEEVLNNISAFEYSPFHGINKESVLYVPASSVDAYKDSWYWNNGYFKEILPIGAEHIYTNVVAVTSTECTAEISWPVSDEVLSFVLVIYNADNEEVCRAEMYYDGELISVHYNKPRKDQFGAATEQEGLSYKVVGLEPGTTYRYTIQSFDSEDVLLNTQTGVFATEGKAQVEYNGGTNIVNQLEELKPNSIKKTIQNGQLIIVMPEGEKYNANGVRVQ